ncbi:MAG: four helix bundle protein [Eubacteriales bacterium]|nr:four helix bundle protein [Eubacteriales bacterium]
MGGFISFHIAQQYFTWAQAHISHSASAEYFTKCMEKGFLNLSKFLIISPKNLELISMSDIITIEVIQMADSKLRDLSMDFAVNILRQCEQVKGHYSLVNQLERSATSIGANIHEANYAHGRQDFIAKLQISLKECYETEYWMELFQKARILEPDTGTKLMNDCGTIRRILIASINTAKGNGKGGPNAG